MCGIAGILEPEPRAETPALVARMLSKIAHRGPDGEAVVADETGRHRAVLGHRRLAIFDLSDAARQPMARNDGRWWIVFNGAIYNAPEIRGELETLGDRFATTSDTEVLLAAWIRWGRAALDRLNGMWAFAVWDRKLRQLTCCRDRYGVKPFYWARDQSGRFAFASEPKALRPFAASEPDADVVRRYLATGLTIGGGTSRTVYGNYRTLPEGSLLEISPEGLTEAKWYAPPRSRPEEGQRLDPIEAEHRLADLLREAVRIRLRSDVPVGAFLSGGMDSSSIVALAAGLEPAETRNYTRTTISLEYPDAPEIDESGYARDVIERAGCHGVFVEPTGRGLEDDLDRFVFSLDDLGFFHGFYATEILSREASARGIRVVLTGQGSDEQLGGYEPWDVYLRALWKSRRRVAAAREAFLSGARLWGPARSLRRLNFRLRAAASSRPIDGICGARPSLRGHLHHQFFLDYLPVVLRFEDRLTMAHGLEARMPFLDHRVIEFLAGVPDDWILNRGWTKWILRRAMRDVLPASVVWRRRKLGMPGPRRDFSKSTLDRVFRARRTFVELGWIDGDASPESGLTPSSELTYRYLVADAWSRQCLGIAREC